MDAGKRAINELFTGNKIFDIPFFQRSYVWDEPQWERLLEDVEDVSRTRVPHFLGSVILKQELTDSSGTVGDVRTVIDGQQRLTTISILLKVYCLKSNKLDRFNRQFCLFDNRPVIQHNRSDIKAFNKIMELESIELIDTKDRVTSAYKYFVDNLNPDKLDYDNICNHILFVGIDLGVEEDEQQIFDTINSLGVRLTTAELLKNYFFTRDDEESYKEHWLNIFEKDDETKEYWDKEITTGRIKRTFIDLFFHSYLQIKVQDKNLGVRADDKDAFSKVEKLFDSYKRFINDYCSNNKHALLPEISAYAETFRKIFNDDIVNDELPPSAGIERITAIIFALETTTLIPYVLFIEQNIEDVSAKNDLYGVIETYVMRRLVTRASNKNYNQLFTDRLVSNRILSEEEFVEHIKEQDDRVNRMPSDYDVKIAFSDAWLTNKNAAGVLYMIESKIRNRNLHSTQLLGIKKYSLEHIMPKLWINNWEFTGDENERQKRNRKLLTLGNLTIITQALNSSIRDADWKKKKSGVNGNYGLDQYAKGIDTFSGYIDRPVWDESAIEERAQFLYNHAINIWVVGSEQGDIIDNNDIDESEFNDEQNIQNLSEIETISKIAEKCIIIKIKQWSIDRFNNETHDAIYEATRAAWKINIDKAREADYVLSVLNGVVMAVYTNMQWGVDEDRGRLRFYGEYAPEVISEKYVGKAIPPEFRQKGLANPCLYVNY